MRPTRRVAERRRGVVAERAQFVSIPGHGEVGALLTLPEPAKAILAFAHGAGAGMQHAFMADTARRLAERGVATLRYQFPYMEAGRRRPDGPPVLVESVRAAVARAAALVPGLPLFAGGKSMGGRMTSTAAAEGGLAAVRGLVLFGFPLHPAGRPSTDRAAHLAAVDVPMLFLQGTRDALADLELMEPVLRDLGPRATLHRLAGADHGFHVLKRSGRTDDEVAADIAERVSGWIDAVLRPGSTGAAEREA